MKIISWNVNGLRASCKKGFSEWLEKSKADIVCLQETKAWPEQLSPKAFKPKGYYAFFSSAVKKGYSGVAVYTKKKPLKTEYKLGIKRFDQEGRILKLKYPDFTLINLYLPHGGREKENLIYKLKTYNKLLKYLEKIKNKRIILVGDFNIAHKEIDLARPKQNQKNTMFTLKERKQIDEIIKMGFTDTFRKFYQGGGHYAWWPYAYNARRRNLGWRIDYIFTSRLSTLRLKNAFILKKVKGSDHCPIGITI